MTLDITALVNAVSRLEEGFVRYQSDTSDAQIRDGLIQRFEFTYEISHKILKRYLELTAPSPDEIDRMSFSDVVRTGNERGLLKGDWPAWRRFREMRSKTSHTYNESVAQEVVAGIPAFLAEAAHLRDQLASRLS